MSNAVGRPMEILLVEDSLLFARMTIGALKRSNIQHRLTWLKDGAEAMEFLEQAGKYRHAPRPDLVLLDLELPHKDGREVLADVRGRDELRELPVVILTSSTSPEDMEASERLAVEGYLTKPVDQAAFLGLVRNLSRFWREDMIVPVN
jgi:two-component system, chemotaxis family, response regulator Rcp1